MPNEVWFKEFNTKMPLSCVQILNNRTNTQPIPKITMTKRVQAHTAHKLPVKHKTQTRAKTTANLLAFEAGIASSQTSMSIPIKYVHNVTMA